MKIALSGYGKMGRMVEQTAHSRNIEVVCIIEVNGILRGQLGDADVCIDFTEPGAVIENIRAAASAGVPIVVGTTGWYDRLDEARALVEESGISLVYGANFSIGVNLMFLISRYAAELFSRFSAYDPFIEEAHHKFKKDAPSGTALVLKQIVEQRYSREIPVASTRAGYIPGRHMLGFDAEADTLAITHVARNRAGFAEGALLAAEWIAGRKGFYEFRQIFDVDKQ